MWEHSRSEFSGFSSPPSALGTVLRAKLITHSLVWFLFGVFIGGNVSAQALLNKRTNEISIVLWPLGGSETRVFRLKNQELLETKRISEPLEELKNRFLRDGFKVLKEHIETIIIRPAEPSVMEKAKQKAVEARRSQIRFCESAVERFELELRQEQSAPVRDEAKVSKLVDGKAEMEAEMVKKILDEVNELNFPDLLGERDNL